MTGKKNVFPTGTYIYVVDEEGNGTNIPLEGNVLGALFASLIDSDGHKLKINNDGSITANVGNAQIVIDPSQINLDFSTLEALIGGLNNPTDGSVNKQLLNLYTLITSGAGAKINGTVTATIDESTLATSAKQDTSNTYLGKLVDSTAGIKASENHLGEVGGSSIQVSASPTVATTAYAGTTVAPVCVGSVLTFTNAMRISGGTGVLQSIDVIDTNVVKAPLLLVLFNQNPNNGTYTDKSAPVFGTDAVNIIRTIPINASDYVQLNATMSIADLSPGGRMLTGVGSANIYGLLLTTGTPTYSGATALTVKLGIMRD